MRKFRVQLRWLDRCVAMGAAVEWGAGDRVLSIALLFGAMDIGGF